MYIIHVTQKAKSYKKKPKNKFEAIANLNIFFDYLRLKKVRASTHSRRAAHAPRATPLSRAVCPAPPCVVIQGNRSGARVRCAAGGGH